MELLMADCFLIVCDKKKCQTHSFCDPTFRINSPSLNRTVAAL